MKSFCRYLLFCYCLFLPSISLALDLGDSLQIHGFVSQGYLHSSGNDFLADSDSGSIEFTDLGLNANWTATDSFRLGGQVFYRNLGDYTEDRIVLDWGLIDYQPLDSLGLRLGKIKMPLGLYNENRDSDFLQPMIFLPQSIYDESRRDTNLAYLGGGIYGNLPTCSWGDLDYHLFVGESDFPDDSILAASTERSLRSAIGKNNKLPANKKNSLLPSALNSSERKSEELYGGAIIFNSSVTDLRIGFSLLHSKNKVFVNGAAEPLVESTVHSKFVLSLEYSWQDWLFATEYGETDRQSKSAGMITMDGPSQSWYLMFSYSPFEDWTFSALYDEFYRLKHDKDGRARPQTPSYMGWRKDLAFAVRHDFSEAWNLKAEFHYIDGGALQMTVTNPDGVDRYWNYFAAKLSYSF